MFGFEVEDSLEPKIRTDHGIQLCSAGQNAPAWRYEYRFHSQSIYKNRQGAAVILLSGANLAAGGITRQVACSGLVQAASAGLSRCVYRLLSMS